MGAAISVSAKRKTSDDSGLPPFPDTTPPQALACGGPEEIAWLRDVVQKGESAHAQLAVRYMLSKAEAKALESSIFAHQQSPSKADAAEPHSYHDDFRAPSLSRKGSHSALGLQSLLQRSPTGSFRRRRPSKSLKRQEGDDSAETLDETPSVVHAHPKDDGGRHRPHPARATRSLPPGTRYSPLSVTSL
jgi:hypothetical protein